MAEHFPDNLDFIFNPKSIAVLGTNNTIGTVPHDIFESILSSGFQGTLYPVSPGNTSIKSVKAYKYIVDIEDPVDLAVIVFPSNVCHMALEQCGQKGVKSAIIISAGFKEVGGKGLEREAKIKEIAKKYGISFIGPNCLGAINTDPAVRLNASFARKMPDAGQIGFLSQSGALCTAVLDYAQSKHIGFSKFVSFGNKADISEIDLLYYLAQDESTKVILLYLEEIGDGQALMEAGHDIVRTYRKPVLLLKSGRTNEGAAAAASHTGSLAGSDEICTAAMEQCGIIRCSTIEEMFNHAIALAYQPIPQDRRVAIITNAGGPGVLATDATIQNGLQLARFSEETTKAFQKALPKTANIKNPVDVIGDARVDRYETAISRCIQDENVDGVFVILTPQSMTDIEAIAETVCHNTNGTPKPVYTSFMGEADVAAGIDILQRHEIPHYILPESMCRSYAAAYRFQQELGHEDDRPEAVPVLEYDAIQAMLTEAAGAGQHMLSIEQANRLMEAYGIPVAKSALAENREDAAAKAEAIGFPAAMKISDDSIVHKFDIGGVVLNVQSADDAKTAYDSIVKSVAAKHPELNAKQVYVQQMIPQGEEVILGCKRDPSFGPVLLFGLGGIFVEIFQDVCFRIAPAGPRTVRSMIESVKGYPLLSGARGRTVKDIAGIERCLQGLSQLICECPQISELDINPLIVLEQGQGCFAADIKIVLQPGQEKEPCVS